MTHTLNTLAGPALLTFALCTIAFAVVLTF